MKEKLKNQIQEMFPEQKIIAEADGWGSYAFSVGEYIVRVPKKYIGGYQKEEKVLCFLKDKVSVEIPEVKVIVNDDLSYAIHKKIEGKNWNIKTYNALSPESQDLFCQDIASFFAELHQISVNDVAPLLKSFDYDKLITKEQIQSYLKDDFTSNEIDKIYNWFQETEALKTDLVFIHNDFHKGNSLVDDVYRLKGVFDFCGCCVEDRCLEFHSLYSPNYMELLQRVIKFYEDITNIKIDINKVKRLKEQECIQAIAYLAEDPNLKSTMKKDWDLKIDELRWLVNNAEKEI